MGKIDHPNVLRLESIQDTAENICIVTEYCNGGDLEGLIKREKKLNEEKALSIMKEVI